MKNNIKLQFLFWQRCSYAMALLLFFASGNLQAQDTTEATSTEPVKYTFESAWIIDNQTVMVPIAGSVEFDIQHRFGTINNGADDVWGIFAPSNIRLALGYVPIKRLWVGVGLTKDYMVADFNAKYALLLQTPGKMPVSVTYYGNIGLDTRDGSYFEDDVDRFSYFNQLMVARKITDKISMQVAPSFSWFNNVEGYVDAEGEVQPKMEHGHFAIAFSGVYKVSKKFAILANYDQPLTEHLTNNPDPNLSLGVELSTGSHAFQIFFGNYAAIVPQYNNVKNQNDYRESQYVIGFNITRLWD